MSGENNIIWGPNSWFGKALATAFGAAANNNAPPVGVETEEKWVEAKAGGIQKVIDSFVNGHGKAGSRMMYPAVRRETILNIELDKPGGPLAKSGISLRYRGEAPTDEAFSHIQMCLKWAMPKANSQDGYSCHEYCVLVSDRSLPPNFQALLDEYNPDINPPENLAEMDEDQAAVELEKHRTAYEILKQKIAEIECYPGDWEVSQKIRSIRESHIVTLNDQDRRKLGITASNKSIFIEMTRDQVEFCDMQTGKYWGYHEEMEMEILTKHDQFIDPHKIYVSQNLTHQNVKDCCAYLRGLIASIDGEGALEKTNLSKSERAQMSRLLLQAARIKAEAEGAHIELPQTLSMPDFRQAFAMFEQAQKAQDLAIRRFIAS